MCLLVLMLKGLLVAEVLCAGEARGDPADPLAAAGGAGPGHVAAAAGARNAARCRSAVLQHGPYVGHLSAGS